MPEYIAKAYLLHNGKVIEPEKTLELTEEQAENLSDKVEPTKEVVLKEKTVPELKKEAKEKGIEGISKMDKDALIEALKEE
ncbi:Rho termination factor N-terminal domain-containing protein [Priestia megaterium]